MKSVETSDFVQDASSVRTCGLRMIVLAVGKASSSDGKMSHSTDISRRGASRMTCRTPSRDVYSRSRCTRLCHATSTCPRGKWEILNSIALGFVFILNLRKTYVIGFRVIYIGK